MIRKLIALAKGKNIALVDTDGAITLTRAYKLGEVWFADRIGWGIRTVILCENGVVPEGSYVKSWFPV